MELILGTGLASKGDLHYVKRRCGDDGGEERAEKRAAKIRTMTERPILTEEVGRTERNTKVKIC